MQRKSLLILFVISLSLLLNLFLSSCATVPDVPVCTKINLDKGWCTYTISEKEFYWDENHLYNGKTWWQATPTMIYLPLESWVKIKEYIIYECKKNSDCADNIGTWEGKISKGKKKMGVK
jgi:hypothetical protein